jgi:hypothetical protein
MNFRIIVSTLEKLIMLKILRKIITLAISAGSLFVTVQTFAANLGNYNIDCSGGSINTTAVNVSGAVGDTFSITNTSTTWSCGSLDSQDITALSFRVGQFQGRNGSFVQFVGGSYYGADSNKIVLTLAQSGTNNFTINGVNSGSKIFAVTTVAPVPVPTVASVSPSSGSTAGGTAITITGTDLTGATAITVGGAACTSVVASATSATCTTPAGTAGTASVLVTTSGGTNAANTLFTYQTNAVCGTAASLASSIVPSANLCTAGTAGQVSSSQGQYSWTCSGISGGTNASCAAPWATNAGTGSGSLSASGNGWTVSSASFAATPTATPPAGVTFPNGLLDLRLSTGSSGTDATVVVQYTTAVPAGAVYMKYGKTAANQTDHWYQLDASRAVFAADRMSVTLTLTDGGAGDHDLLANGTIVDPGGPALVPAPTAVPTLSEWAMIFLASLMGMFAYTRIRRQS